MSDSELELLDLTADSPSTAQEEAPPPSSQAQLQQGPAAEEQPAQKRRRRAAGKQPAAMPVAAPSQEPGAAEGSAPGAAAASSPSLGGVPASVIEEMRAAASPAAAAARRGLLDSSPSTSAGRDASGAAAGGPASRARSRKEWGFVPSFLLTPPEDQGGAAAAEDSDSAAPQAAAGRGRKRKAALPDLDPDFSPSGASQPAHDSSVPQSPASPGGRGRGRGRGRGGGRKGARSEAEKAAAKAERERARAEKAAAKLADKAAAKEDREAARLQNKVDKGEFALQHIRPTFCNVSLPKCPAFMEAMKRMSDASLTVEMARGEGLPLRPYSSMVWHRLFPTPEDPQATVAVPYVLVHLTGEQAAQLVQGPGLQSLVSAAAEAHPGCTLGVVIEGLDSYCSRQEAADIKRYGRADPRAFRRGPLKAALADLLVRWPGVRHRSCVDSAAAAEHIHNLTIALAQQPFRQPNPFLHLFGGSSASNAKDRRDLLARHPLPGPELSVEGVYQALCSVPGIHARGAHAIACAHPGLAHLYRKYADPGRSDKQKAELVADLILPAAAGSLHDQRRVGPVISKKLRGFLMATDASTPISELR